MQNKFVGKALEAQNDVPQAADVRHRELICSFNEVIAEMFKNWSSKAGQLTRKCSDHTKSPISEQPRQMGSATVLGHTTWISITVYPVRTPIRTERRRLAS